MAKYEGGCEHVRVSSDKEPLDNHYCHCNVCKGVTGQPKTHLAFFDWVDLKVDHPEKLKRQPYNKNNPDGPLELCTCAECGAPILVDDKQHRIRVAAPHLMGYDLSTFPGPTYHAFWDESKGPKPNDGMPVYEELQPSFHMPAARA